ncbi:MAG: molybdopterin-dependent oxidoreductase [Chloroflexi bacterium]|nr:molybdopterin-dependent oxidoreductase [Chloroflexota bacterium]
MSATVSPRGKAPAPQDVWEDAWVPTTCYACNHGPDLIRVHRVNGVAVGVDGNRTGPGFVELTQARGKTCPKPFGLVQKIYNPHRIKSPLKRTNPVKGRGVDPKWVEITWDEALDTIAARLKTIRARDSRGLALAVTGNQMFQLKGTWDAFKAAYGPTQALHGGGAVHCDFAEHVFGNQVHGGWSCEPDVVYSTYCILLGRNPRASGGVGENVQYGDAQARGMKMVVVDPVLTVSAAKADEWVPIRPGTDLAFELALIHTILHEIKVWDADFLKTLTNSPYLVGPDGYFVRDPNTGKALVWDPVAGLARAHDDELVADLALEGTCTANGVACRPAFQVLKDHVLGYTPEWASAITDIPAGTIRRIAREWVDHAQIGKTIQIEGITLPYRPVSTKIGRGLTGNMRSFQSISAEHILAALVGALEAVGGHCGGRAVPGGFYEKFPHRGIAAGADGMVATDAYPFTWPPVSPEGSETLVPFLKVVPSVRAAHLAYKNLADPPPNYPPPPAPEMLIQQRTNLLLSVGDPPTVEKALLRIPFMVSIAYVLDEMTELADIVLPEHLEMERYELGTQVRRPLSRIFSLVSLRQPAVAPRLNTKDIADILTELAERTGFLDAYNRAVNDKLELSGPYRLEPGVKYGWEDMVDRQCQSVTGGAHDLAWFKEHGAITQRVSVDKQYSVHPRMVARKLRYPIPYMEFVKKTGDDLRRGLDQVGVRWWPTDEYTPLPTYFPSIMEEAPPQYDMYGTTTRSILASWGANSDQPWMIELGQQELGAQRIMIARATARAKGIADGDEVWVESPVGRVKGKVKLIEGIHPQTVLIEGAFGQWATPIARDTGRVSLTPLVPIDHKWTDQVVGCMQGHTVKVKVYQA